MPPKKNLPVALTIAGSDSGGGAGMQADLRVFQSVGVHGASVVTALTAQNPKSVQAAQPVNAKLVQQQLESVFKGFKVKAAKTGMLLTASNVDVVSEWFGGSWGLRCSLRFPGRGRGVVAKILE